MEREGEGKVTGKEMRDRGRWERDERWREMGNETEMER